MFRVYTAKEVAKHKTRDSCWIVLHDQVLDITKFIMEHPGGPPPLLKHAGTDATQYFEEVGHSAVARELVQKFKIGTFGEGECVTCPPPKPKERTNAPCPVTKKPKPLQPESSKKKKK